MKIRIKGNSVRFRLTQSEVRTLSEHGEIYDSTNFGETEFKYGVVLDNKIHNLHTSFNNNCIVLKMPSSIGKEWYSNDIITFDHTVETTKNQSLYLLLEKDFTCLDNTIEDQSDNYPNPKLT
ncbi:DUF7009 family protein [Maribacter sp. MAR_2009_72]|uniref:DUF7009 family protein n=1 Tax=Maribacter sp. MAR_2009_72 TaxID=1250050 RepID=UPI001199769E|nr:hypothetical protein [Maribacter sp. MAR_2009_72]TVZ16598.1 hypothetical protein JM81_2862 [Maribacter sp. MAR_2009_72]